MKETTSKLELVIEDLDFNWRCFNGLIHTNPVNSNKEPSTLNGVLYTGIVVAMIESAIQRNLVERTSKIDTFLNSCEQAIKKCYQDKYPMICRTPTNQDQQGPDDYKGYAAYAALRNQTKALLDLLEYGNNTSVRPRPWLPRLIRWTNNSKNNFRVFDKLSDDASFFNKALNALFAPWGYKLWASPWMGRFPALTWQFEVGSRQAGVFWKELWAFFSLAIQAYFGGTKKPDSWYMDWTIIVINRHSIKPSKLINFISDKWFKKLYSLYPQGMKEVWAQYTAQHEEKFPLSRFFIE